MLLAITMKMMAEVPIKNDLPMTLGNIMRVCRDAVGRSSLISRRAGVS